MYFHPSPPWIELSSLVDVLLKLEPVEDLLADAAELAPAAQGDGKPFVRFRIVFIASII